MNLQKALNIPEIVDCYNQELNDRSIENLLTEFLQTERFRLYIDKFCINDAKKLELFKKLQKLIRGNPVQYLTNVSYFMDFRFYVDERCFVPRPETEILVDCIIETLKNKKKDVRGLDLCSGSGCIAISLVQYLPNVTMISSDISEPAIEVLKKNIQEFKISHKIKVIKSNLFDSFNDDIQMDFIVSNPPYICSEEIKNLPPEVRKEPRIALDGGRKGTALIEKIIQKAPDLLKSGGYIFLEIGHKQDKIVADFVSRNPGLNLLKFVKDYNNIERVVIIRKTGYNG